MFEMQLAVRIDVVVAVELLLEGHACCQLDIQQIVFFFLIESIESPTICFLPGLPANRSERIDVFGVSGIVGAAANGGCDGGIFGCLKSTPADVGFVNASLSGVIFLRRPLFFAGPSRKPAAGSCMTLDDGGNCGGRPSSEGSSKRVFCTSKTAVGIMGS